MALKTKLGKADYDALDESLQKLYVPDGENYKLDADYEDVTGLKAKNAELLGDLKELKEKFKDIDPEVARKAVTELEEARRKNLTDEERHQEDLKKLKKDLDTEKLRSKALFDTQAERDLHLTLANNKVKADKIEDAAIVLRHRHLKAEEVDGKPAWKSLDGSPIEKLDDYITGLRNSKADWFEPTTQTGGGAAGSGNNGGNGNTITRKEYDANPYAYAKQIQSGDLTLTD